MNDSEHLAESYSDEDHDVLVGYLNDCDELNRLNKHRSTQMSMEAFNSVIKLAIEMQKD